ncbi:MAG TPA: hypothetical protein VNJ01_17555 [Bacteriovoracaceae bacterium]|nr:hypothetical protein [Bacteriovoracaceae bacterium]
MNETTVVSLTRTLIEHPPTSKEGFEKLLNNKLVKEPISSLPSHETYTSTSSGDVWSRFEVMIPKKRGGLSMKLTYSKGAGTIKHMAPLISMEHHQGSKTTKRSFG